MYSGSLPIATKWLLDAVGDVGRCAINSVCMIIAKETGQKGTGFLLRSGYIITAFHVIEGCGLTNLFAIMSSGESIKFKGIIYDPLRDLAILQPDKRIKGGLEIHSEKNVKVGMQVYTWGYPLGYNGPAPLLTVGFLSGFIARKVDEKTVVKHLVVNSAFNPSNSGGPLFISGRNEVVGVVVSKHLPMSRFVVSAIRALAENRSGVVFKSVDDKGKERKFVESQIVAEIFETLQGLNPSSHWRSCSWIRSSILPYRERNL